MRRPRGQVLSLVLCVLVGSARADDSAGKLVYESWDAAYLDQAKAGHVHTTVREIEQNDGKVLRTAMELDLSVQRFGQTARLYMKTGTDETPDGVVTGVFMSMLQGKNQRLALTGAVDGDELRVKVNGVANPVDKKIWWNPKVIGLYREQNLFKEKKVKPGATFSYLHYEPSLNAVVTVRVEVKDYEDIEVGGQKSQLLRVISAPDKLLGVQLPPSTLWLNKNRVVVRSEAELPSLGKLTLVRTSREKALRKEGGPAKIADIGFTQLIRLNRRIPNAHDADQVVYRITLPKDEDPRTAFARGDGRQEVKNVNGKSFELHVRAVRGPKEDGDPDAEAAEEFLKSNYFINSADAKVKEHARAAVGRETDPWKKAQRIEKWVRNNMRVVNFTEAMASADHVARTLEGDCTEFAMLTAAMCRAAKVPARVAIGFVYGEDDKRGPFLGYHMWTEVFVRGGWVPLDATLGRGAVGACHLKITDHSWSGVDSLSPLLPVMRVTNGKIAVEVVSVDGEE